MAKPGRQETTESRYPVVCLGFFFLKGKTFLIGSPEKSIPNSFMKNL
jgi:hypothetical protein